jgi:allantoate deiminase
MLTTVTLTTQPLLQEVLLDLARFGAESGGGVTRLLYTPAWRAAHDHLAGLMRRLGLRVHADRVGNLFGRLDGTEADAPVVLTGSHLDTVTRGGTLDGAYGIAAGIAALVGLRETCGTPRRPLEVVAFCEEEGSRFPLTCWGSGNMTGIYDWREAGRHRDAEGVTLRDAMEAAGFGLAEQPDSRRTDLGVYVEAHIEQGIVLERLGKQIGIVETIVGQRRIGITVGGRANHAGTTPMDLRRDALAGAAEMILELETLAVRAGKPLVATVGYVEARPNTSNVIPGSVVFTLDLRHTDEERLAGFCRAVLERFAMIAQWRGLTLEHVERSSARPAPMDARLRDALQTICEERGLSHLRMVSGAGHDAQMFRSVCPAGMLFVPSRDGVSHSPEEYSAPEALADGLEVLGDLLHRLAYGDSRV